jgi:hypothetical protein
VSTMKNKFDKSDPTVVYRQKIANVIYSLSGIKRELDSVDNDIVVLLLETKIKAYIKGIFDNIKSRKQLEQTAKIKRKRKGHVPENIKTTVVRITDIYEELQGTVEYYGVKRCIILKKISTTLEKNETVDDDEEEVEDEDEETMIGKPDVAVVPVDRLQQELTKLNDGSRCFFRFEKARLSHMHIVDQLTSHMSLDEYLEYTRFATSKFIDKITNFDRWMGWKMKLSKNIYIAIGWLCVNKIRTLLYSALARRRKYVQGPFYSQMLDRLHPLEHRYFIELENDQEENFNFGLPNGLIETIENQKAIRQFLHYDNAFKNTGNIDNTIKISTTFFETIAQLKLRRQNK